MKILVKDLKPNPFRNMKSYPIDRKKVDSLKMSINQTTFWDNILARPSNNHYEIAYGHHRVQALKELGIEEINISVRDLTDASMIQIMANENHDDWKTKTAIILETILVAKEYLDNELLKYNNWHSIPAQEFLRMATNDNTFSKLKKEGVGQGILKKFLGDNWSDYHIQNALAIIKNVDVDAIKQFDNFPDAIVISQAVRENNVPINQQAQVIDAAHELLDSDKYKKVDTGRVDDRGLPRKEWKEKAAIEEALEKENIKTCKENFNKVFPKERELEKPDLNDVARNIIYELTKINCALPDIFRNWNYLENQVKAELGKFISRFFELIKKNKEKGEWKLLG